MAPRRQRSPPTSTTTSPNNSHFTEIAASETSPLLGHNRRASGSGIENGGNLPSRRSTSWAWWPQFKPTKTRRKSSTRTCRWHSVIAGIILAIFVILALLLGFVVPGIVKEYAQQAVVIEPTGLSVESITSDGVKARIVANFRLDGSRVDDVGARRIGRWATSTVKKLETDKTTIGLYLPEYEDALLGSTVVPGFTIDIVDGHNTVIDVVADLIPGNVENIRAIANNWLDGKLERIKVTGKTAVRVKSGIIPLGTHNVAESLVLEASKMPSIPDYKIDNLEFHDITLGGGSQKKKAVGSNVTLSVSNDYSIGLDVPPLGFDILIDNCNDSESEPHITVAEAVTDIIHVRPHTNISVNALGVIGQIPKSLIRICPGTKLSPLDHFMERYLHGQDSQVWVRGKSVEGSDTPEWMSSILNDILVPVDIPGNSFGDAIRNFSVTDVNFKLPSPFADPNDPDAVPRVSGNMKVLAALPKEMKVDIGVNGIKSTSDLFYKGKKMGELNLKHWQDATSKRVLVDDEDMIEIMTRAVDVPLKITDQDVFGEILQKMLFGDENLVLDIKAAVDVQVSTVLGNIAVKGVPAKGKIPVKSLPTNTLNKLMPRVDDVQILNTSATGAYMSAIVNFTNPTPYTASIPWFHTHIYMNDSKVGEALVTDLLLELGNNSNRLVHATWDPMKLGGEKSHAVSRKLLSDYLSGENTTLEIRAHSKSFPRMPILGQVLSQLNFTIPTPRLSLPGEDGDSKSNNHEYIREAVFHIFSSTAAFKLASPLRHNTVYIDYINATAYYNHTEPIGQIIYDDSLTVPPGISQTPRLPVEWSAEHIGYDKLMDALGGRLKLDAVAEVTVRMGNWVETVTYRGSGIGARVSI